MPEAIIRAFFISLSFLTIFNFGKTSLSDMTEVGRSSWSFPVVGALLGLALFFCNWILARFLPLSVSAFITVGLWVFFTGGLHLDGWTDCWDALGAAVSAERRAEIMKDSRLGSFGAMGLFLILGLKAACLSSGFIGLCGFLLATVAGRALIITGFRNCCFIKPGMAQSFAAGIDSRTYNLTWILTLAFAILSGVTGIVALLVAFGVVFVFRRFAEAKLGFINGDVMGASCELSETMVLIALNWR